VKLKYLIRGIGIGVFAAGLVALIVSLTAGKMSDEKILERARQLGYEDRNVVIQEIRNEDGPVKLTDQTPANSTKDTSEKNIATEVLPDGVENSESTSQVTGEDKKAEEEAKKAEEEAKKKAEEEAKKAEEEKKKAEEAKKAEEEKKKAEEEAKKQSQATGETVTITVKSGQFSETVAKMCETAGLVDSATKFDDFMCKNGYSGRISVGDHKIAKGSSYEEIAKALCK
jgi:nucleoid-associated protein YgaU